MFKNYPTARYILQRGVWYFLTFLVAVIINFALPRLGDRNPVDIMMAKASQGLSDEALQLKKEGFEKEFGMVKLDDQGQIVRDASGQSVKTTGFEQFIDYLGMTMRGNFGISIQKYPKKVLDIVIEAVPWTIALQLPAILFGWIVGNLLGALSAYKRGVFDRVIFPMALFISSVPFFVFGMVLVYVFAVVLGWFPAMGAYAGDLVPSFSLDFIGSMGYHYVLPFLSIFMILAGGQAIGMRSMGIYELGTDYIKYAKWLGLKESKVLSYLFRNAMLPQLTGLALSIGQMVGGALITEMIFSYPGLGMAMLTAIGSNDYTVIQGCTLLITICVLVANFTVDIMIGFLDPRVKAGLQMGGK
jgi:peptide/nickel transport system permease protein